MARSIGKILLQIKPILHEKSYKSILICYTGYVAFKDLRYVKINSANSLHLIIGRIDWYFEEINGNKYLALVPADKNKEITKKHEELWSKI